MQWAHIEETAKASIQERKIRVLFLPAQGGVEATTPAKANGFNDSIARSPSPEAVTPQRGADSTPASTARDNVTAAASTASAAVASGANAVANAIPTNTEDLKAQLAAANAQILKLKDDASAGLRQRKAGLESRGSAPGSATSTLQQAPAGGVAVQYVAGLCLLSFLLAYFLF